MATAPAHVEVLRVETKRYAVDEKNQEIAAALEEAFGTPDANRLFPLVPTLLEIELALRVEQVV